MAKYRNLADLVEARRDGQLPGGVLYLDNDDTHMTGPSADGNPYHRDEWFSMHPAELLEQALTLLGIPWEHV